MRFACTGCGKCCNRAPEMELSESLALADAFVFRLMFRLYWLPQQLRDFTAGREKAGPSSVFYEKKRLLNAFAARRYPAKIWRDGKRVPYDKFLMVSALALDTTPGTCTQLTGSDCRIYDRRPLSCRSVPLHYSRTEGSAGADLAAFVSTDGYRCDTSEAAPLVLDEGRIVDPAIKAARAEALAAAQRDRRWSAAIVRRMNGDDSLLPSLAQIEANAEVGATTTSMRPAWQIAADQGLISTGDLKQLVERQLAAIKQELAHDGCSPEARETLTDMQKEYRRS